MTKGTWMVAVGGMFGAIGVASAAASHNDTTGLLGTASIMLLAHAPVLIALYVARTHISFVGTAALILTIGTILFTGDLAVGYTNANDLNQTGQMANGLFPMAAPIGGVLMIAGWLVIIVCSFFQVRRQSMSHSASFHLVEIIAPSNAGTKHLGSKPDKKSLFDKANIHPCIYSY